MGIEILKDGQLYVNRAAVGDANYLLSIRNGDVSYDLLKAEAERLFAELDEAYTNSTLPKHVNTNKVNSLCIEMVEAYGL